MIRVMDSDLLFDKKKNTIYLDCDNVLADFDKFICEVWSHEKFENGQYPCLKLWAYLEANHQDIFSKLEPLAGAYEIVESAYKITPNVEVLTCLPYVSNFPDAEQHKREWIKIHFGDLRVNTCKIPQDKKFFAKKSDVLVDDREDSVREWHQFGGIGIHHLYSRPEETLNILRVLESISG